MDTLKIPNIYEEGEEFQVTSKEQIFKIKENHTLLDTRRIQNIK